MAPSCNLYKKLLERRRRRRKSASKKSVSAKPSEGLLMSSVKALLECPVCLTIMYPPIHQCCNGHTICSDCKANVHNICPICRQMLGNIRCLALEKVAESLDLPCKFHTFGCESIFSYQDRLKHEETCSFRQYNCPYVATKCLVTGDITSLVAHLKKDHHVYCVDNGSHFDAIYILPKPLKTENDTSFTLVTCHLHYFCLHLEGFWIRDAYVYLIFFRFMGEENEAKRFRCFLQFGGKGRKMTWEGIPRSIHDSSTTVQNSLDGLIIPSDLARCFSGDGQNLKLKVFAKIWIET